MKFGKEFVSQMVPEWQEAYLDYNYLKTLLKDIQSFKATRKPPLPPPSSAAAAAATLKRNLTRYRAFSGLLVHNPMSPKSPKHDIEEQSSIHVNSVSHNNGSKSYETTFLMAADDGGEYELVYFRRLDDEFNKVERFYRMKVEEVVKEALVLNKQMDGLIAFRIKVENPLGLGFDREKEMKKLVWDVETSTSALAVTTPSGAKESGRIPMQVIEEATATKQDDEESEESSDDGGSTKPIVASMDQTLKSSRKRRPAPLEILNNVRMNNTLETPRSTIKRILKDPRQGELSFNRENLQKVEDRLKRAFIEFYHKLRLLKSYCFLNILAISKIMKKYDKITSRSAAKQYMAMVDNSYLGSSDEVTKLMQRVEETFIKHFSNSNRSKGMNILRPKAKKERHRITFSTGFFGGCTAALVIALILIVRARDIMNQEGRAEYMATMFPLYSLFGFVVLHMLMYAGNIYFWRRYRVNYSFIFGFKQGTELGYREVLLVSFVIGVLALSSVLSNLDMEMDPNTHDYKEFTELVPLNLLLVLTVILFCPFNIIYKSSRYFFLVCLFRSICAPLYKVTLPDFFLADQLTSQVQAFRSVEFYICYYGWGDYKHRRNTCKSEPVFNTFYFIVATIPYWSRFLQCIRRLVEEKDITQGYNGLKYFMTIVAVCLRTAYSINKGMSWKVVAAIFSVIAAIFCTYWDLVHDWGLLKRHSKNRWLRDKMLVPHKSVYFGAMVLNVLLRFAWLQTVLDFQVSFLHRETLIAIVASLEIIRRGIWNFFRLENEHLNNVGHFRAFKSVPLPFNYDEDEDKDE